MTDRPVLAHIGHCRDDDTGEYWVMVQMGPFDSAEEAAVEATDVAEIIAGDAALEGEVD